MTPCQQVTAASQIRNFSRICLSPELAEADTEALAWIPDNFAPQIDPPSGSSGKAAILSAGLKAASAALPTTQSLASRVVVREDHAERRMTAAEAFLLHITKKGLEGDCAAARAAMTAIEQARSRRSARQGESLTIILTSVAPGSVNSALRPLRMATKLDPFRESAWMVLEPWLVEAALKRLGDRRLRIEEQRSIVAATRTPHKVRWPACWEAC
jgi:hypothetical protein